MHTPKSKFNFIALLSFLYMVQFGGHVFHNKAIDDGIGGEKFDYFSFDSPLFLDSLQAQLFVLPIFLLFAAHSVFKYQGLNSVVCWNFQRPIWASLWTLLYGSLIIFSIYDALSIFLISYTSIANVVSSLAIALFFILVRAEVVAKPNNQINED